MNKLSARARCVSVLLGAAMAFVGVASAQAGPSPEFYGKHQTWNFSIFGEEAETPSSIRWTGGHAEYDVLMKNRGTGKCETFRVRGKALVRNDVGDLVWIWVGPTNTDNGWQTIECHELVHFRTARNGQEKTFLVIFDAPGNQKTPKPRRFHDVSSKIDYN